MKDKFTVHYASLMTNLNDTGQTEACISLLDFVGNIIIYNHLFCLQLA